MRAGFPKKQGLYDPRFEHDSCGVGFVCDVNGRKTNKIVRQGIEILKRLSHRGAVGADPKTGDGAGILIQMPHRFFADVCSESGITLPRAGNYGTGMVFLPADKREREFCEKAFLKAIKDKKQEFLGWRDVPINDSCIGKTARDTMPAIRQIFIAKNRDINENIEFERHLYIIRKMVERLVRKSHIKGKASFYITNLSSRTVSYKGLLMPGQLERFFLDLKNPRIESALSMVHSRYSTNTFPTWDLAQPFRFLAHNGEINTLRGNINWMKAREGLLKSGAFGRDIEKLKPVIVAGGSDSAVIDNVFELLTLSGRPMEHAMLMLIPAAWEKDAGMDKKLRDFYRFHSCFMEPWDGPAAIAFTDGTCIGSVLDRNGLRPARYIVTKDGLVVMASEVGVLDIKPEDILTSSRLEPGKMLFIDTVKKRIITDKEIKKEISARLPYGKWIKENMISLSSLSSGKKGAASGRFDSQKETIRLFNVFGYTREDFKAIISPMADKGYEPTGSMGNDTPHAVLSGKPQLLYNYFKQLFAQVTNPAIDFIREEIVMSLEGFVGRQENILSESPGHSRGVWIKNPIMTDVELEALRSAKSKGFSSKTISILFDADDKKSFSKTIKAICAESVCAVKEGRSFIILSDKGVSKNKAALPALLAAGTVHQHLVKKKLRTQISIIIESGEPREVHHFALLFGYGADCVNPYLAIKAVERVSLSGDVRPGVKDAVKNYIKAANKGILKIISKMGISKLQSYRAAQIFEALGLSNEVIELSFTGTASRIEGAGLADIREETLSRHRRAYLARGSANALLDYGGLYQWRRDGEFHLWNPDTIAALQDSVRKKDYKKYKDEFASRINNQSGNPTTLRSLLKFKKTRPVSIDKVEPAGEIVKRFATGAMSFGSISRGAHETLAIVMNRLGGKSNTGEGGEDPARFMTVKNGDSTRSATKQVASGRFGVTSNYLVNADEIQIKIAQGAKPGEGGQLPGHKVSAIIARTRYTTPGVTLISPPPHHDIYSIEDLAQLIFDLKNANPKARISVKLVSEIGVGTVAAGVAKGHADMILISGGDGGTGASPLSSIKYAGLPWELGLSETHQTLVLNNLRSRVRLQTDGQMRTGKDVAIAAILGAEEYGFCTAALIVMGCVMLRHCHLNNCSVGIATQNDILESRFRGRAEDVVTYFMFVTEELREIMARLGVKKIDDLIGRSDLLEIDRGITPSKALGLDFSKLLYTPKSPSRRDVRCTTAQNHAIEKILDRRLIRSSRKVLDKKARSVRMEYRIRNSDRTTGSMLSGEVSRLFGESGLPEGSIVCKFTGVAGQSFGAFLAKGITFELEGLANDYTGKGLSGGRVIVYPDRHSQYRPDESIIIGNTTFYGAINGEAYIRGVAGERFCIRNSGLYAVVEGVGDHGCEYMTGGRIVVLGKTGRNFAAGMSGGIAYVYDEDVRFKDRCNMEMVFLEALNPEDKDTVRMLLENHSRYTGSLKAEDVLRNFSRRIGRFIKVMPAEYKRVLEGQRPKMPLSSAEVSDG